MSTPPDEIQIADLELRSCIGVTEAERATPQRLTVSLVMQPRHGFDGLEDDLARTVNYSTVCKLVRALAGAKARQLIETFALEIADAVLDQFACASVAVELRKYILPDTAYVAVRLVRHRP